MRRNSHLPTGSLPKMSSRTSSASRHMKSSFSFNRLGVSRRLSSERALVCSGGSMVTMCSNIGICDR